MQAVSALSMVIGFGGLGDDLATWAGWFNWIRDSPIRWELVIPGFLVYVGVEVWNSRRRRARERGLTDRADAAEAEAAEASDRAEKAEAEAALLRTELEQAKTSTMEATREAAEEPALRLSAEVVQLPYTWTPDDPTPPVTRLQRAGAGPRFGVLRVENRSGRDISSLIARVFLEDEPWRSHGAWASEPVDEFVPVRLDEGSTLRAGAERLLVLAVVYPPQPDPVGKTWYGVRPPFSHVDYFDPMRVLDHGTHLGTQANFRVVFEAEGVRQEIAFRLTSDDSGPIGKLL